MEKLELLLAGGLLLVSLAMLCGCTRQGASIALPVDQAGQVVQGAGPAIQQGDAAGVDAGLLAELTAELERQLAATGWRNVSAPPTSSGAAAALAFDSASSTLNWGYYSPGDYDQNGEVNVADITPIVLHFGESGEFDQNSIQAVVDGDGNGEINTADITPIAMNFGALVTEYRVYASSDEADYPDGGGDNGPGARFLSVVPLDSATSGVDSRRQFSYALTDPQPFNMYWVRPSDGTIDGTPSNLVSEDNQWPFAVLEAEPDSGLAPLTVRFNGLFSGDIDGSIVKYEWDFDGPAGAFGWQDTGSTGYSEHTYTLLGDYIAQVRVTDDDGATDIDAVPLRVRDLVPPVANLSANPDSGAAPFKVRWDASGSTDDQGRIDRYEWDFNGDGIYEYDSGNGPLTPCYYYEPGEFTARVRVTDNDGLTDTAEYTITTTEGASWHVVPALVTGTEPGDNILFERSALIEANGKPGIAFYEQFTLDTEAELVFMQADDTLGSTWGGRVIIGPGYYPGAFSGEGDINLTISGGRPAVFYIHNWDLSRPENMLANALDENGSSWLEPRSMSSFLIHRVNSQPVEVNGNIALCGGGRSWPGGPVIYMTEYIAMSEDPLGMEWIDSGMSLPFTLFECTLADIGGYLSATFIKNEADDYYTYEGDVMFIQALDEEATSWPSSPVIVVPDGYGKKSTVVIDAGGFPAITYHDTLLDRVMFVRALEADGGRWELPQTLDYWMQGRIRASYHQGRPVLLYTDQVSGGIKFIAANDELGKSWGLPMMVTSGEPEDEIIFPDGLENISGNPAFCSVHPIRGQVEYVSYY